MNSVEIKEKIFEAILKEMPVDPTETAGDLLDAADCLGLIDPAEHEQFEDVLPKQDVYLHIVCVGKLNGKYDEFIPNLEATLRRNCDDLCHFSAHVVHNTEPKEVFVQALLKNVTLDDLLFMRICNLFVLANYVLTGWKTNKSDEPDFEHLSPVVVPTYEDEETAK